MIHGLDNNHYISGNFLNFQMAFDRENYDKLLSKLKYYGIRTTSYKIIKTNLNHENNIDI